MSASIIRPDTPYPLSSRKTLPPMTPSSTVNLKRKLQLDDGDSKRSKHEKTSSTTPPRSVDFKIPAVPARALTPSSSTVAFSSSPPRIAQSPIMETRKESRSDDSLTVTLEEGMAVILGRHRNHARPRSVETTLRSHVPSYLWHLISDSDSPARILNLPHHAKHASRVHAIAELLPENEFKIVVVGQNGIKIDGRRYLSGQSVKLGGREQVDVWFYGATVTLRLPDSEEEQERLFTPPRELKSPLSTPGPDHLPHSPVSSMPPSSPPLVQESSRERRASSPLSNVEAGARDAPEMTKEVKEELLEAPATVPVDTARPVPETLDLPAILASTVVFSGSSKLSLPDLVRHVLESQPSLREHGDEEQWQVWSEHAVETNPMFGKVQRYGKDSSGRPLLPHYFYKPELDSDLSRAKQLGGLVRPLRTVQREGGKAIDWRPVGGGRRR